MEKTTYNTEHERNKNEQTSSADSRQVLHSMMTCVGQHIQTMQCSSYGSVSSRHTDCTVKNTRVNLHLIWQKDLK